MCNMTIWHRSIGASSKRNHHGANKAILFIGILV